jgi:hypothetical protein
MGVARPVIDSDVVRIRPLAVAAFLAVLPGALLKAQTPAIGPEFQANTHTTGHQQRPAVASASSGNFVLAWDSLGQDGSNLGVFARLFGPDGAPLTPEIPVNSFTTGNELLPAISASADGDFVVVWQQEFGQDGSSSGIFGQRFDSGGAPLGAEFQVNTLTTSAQEAAAVASDADGNFVVVWQSFGGDGNGFGIIARRFDANGAPLSSDFVVNETTTGNQLRPRVAATPSGAFVVVWQDDAGGDGELEGVFGRRFDAAGNPVSSEFPINVYTTGNQAAPAVAIDATGAFVATWRSEGQDGSVNGVFARRYDALGNPLSGEIGVNAYTSGDQQAPVAALRADGRFVVAWEGQGEDGGAPINLGVFAQEFSPAGVRIGQAFLLNEFTASDAQNNPEIAFDPSGQFVIAWQSLVQDGDDFGVFARRAGFPDGAPMSVDERASGETSNENGVFEAGETVTVDPSWRNLSAAELALSGTAGDFTGPAGPVYTLNDTSSSYGDIPSGGTADCFSASGNCFEMRITGARPAAHWDAAFTETLDSGVGKTWSLHVGESFADAPTSNLFYAFIENIFHNGVTAGGFCGGYCPDDSTLRKQMAVFVLKAKEGAAFIPPAATGVFNDVPAADPFAPWIEELFRRGVVAGCTAPGGPNYCPDDPVLRQQMAAFLLRTLEGAAYVPPGCTGVFDDVPCPGLFTDFVEELAAREIAAGCGGGNYCPAAPTTRGQMAPFLVKTFALELYGP